MHKYKGSTEAANYRKSMTYGNSPENAEQSLLVLIRASLNADSAYAGLKQGEAAAFQRKAAEGESRSCAKPVLQHSFVQKKK